MSRPVPSPLLAAWVSLLLCHEVVDDRQGIGGKALRAGATGANRSDFPLAYCRENLEPLVYLADHGVVGLEVQRAQPVT